MQILDLGKLSQYKFQYIPITIANGSAAGTYESNIQLDRQYNKIFGVGFVEILDGGALANQYNVGARTQRQTWFDPINTLFWTANGNVGPMQKYYSANIPYVSGDTFYAIINTTVATDDDFAAQMVLILGKDLTQVPM